jgi:endogenous inhibitor of DNA gyrase (YacG/DUF329 family)
MPHASHRLDLVLVPDDPEREPQVRAWPALRDAWTARGWLRECRPGPESQALIVGGFERIWISLPGKVTLYANQQGGYRVACPRCQAPLVAEFARAHERYKEGGPRALDCPACGARVALEDLRFAPEAAFGRFAIALSDVHSLDLEPAAKAEIEAAFGKVRNVLRRVG